MNLEKARDNFMSPVIKDNFKRISMEEVESTYSLLVVAGSETTLTGTVNYVIQNRQQLDRLTREIRERFQDQTEITFPALKELPFLNSVVHGGLRLCNSVPGGLPRCVPKGGGTVCGHLLAKDVSQFQLKLHQSKSRPSHSPVVSTHA
jgi:cytochrome P450